MCPGTRLLGNARALLDDTAGAITAGYERCGPVFGLRAAWRRYTIVAGPEAGVLMAQGLDKRHLSRHRIFGSVAREFGRADLVLAEIGPRHARLRPPLAVAYSRHVASPHVAAMVEAVRRQVRAWPEGGTVEAVRQVKQLAFAQYCALVGATRLSFRDGLLATDYMMNVAAGLLPALVFRAPWYRRAHQRTYRVLCEMVERLRQRGRGGDPPTLLDALASVRDPAGAPLTDDEIVSYAAYGIGASIGYVGRLASFMLYEILRDPALRDAVVAEVQAAYAAGDPAEASAVRRLVILRSAYDETLRVHAVAIGMPFDVESDFEFLGVRIGRGERLVLSPVPSSFSAAAFPDPRRFDAARCRAPRNEHRRSGACQPFGLGDRTCAAMGLVELMTMTLVATVLGERSLAMRPAGYRLRLTMRPLPSPDRHFRLGVAAGPPAPRPAPSPPAAGPADDEALATFPGHDEPAVLAALAGAVRRTIAPGEIVIREGDTADAFYLIEEGSVEVARVGAAATTRLAMLTEGEWFGEIGLLENAPRNATVSAGAAGAVVRVLGREAFLTMVAASDLVATEIGMLLRKRVACQRLQEAVPQLSAEARASLLPEFSSRRYPVGDVIVREGEAADEFFVVVAGSVDVSRRDAAGAATAVARLGAGEYFGEMGLLDAAPRNATVTAGEGGVEVLVATRAGFERLLAESGGPRGELARAMRARVERLGG